MTSIPTEQNLIDLKICPNAKGYFGRVRIIENIHGMVIAVVALESLALVITEK